MSSVVAAAAAVAVVFVVFVVSLTIIIIIIIITIIAVSVFLYGKSTGECAKIPNLQAEPVPRRNAVSNCRMY